MYAYRLVVLVLGAAAACAYPVASMNSVALTARPEPVFIENPHTATLQAKRQIHNADYQANGPPPSPNPHPAEDSSSPSLAKPTPSEPVSKDKRSDSGLWRGSSPSVVDEKRQIHNADYQANGPPPSPNPAQDSSSPSAANPAPSEPVQKDKRQIHNADYQANGPPSSPNPAPSQESSSPAHSPAAAPSDPAPKDKRSATSFEHVPSSSRMEKRSVAIKKRSMSGSAGSFGGNVANHRVSRITDTEWYGWRRRNVEELTNIHNRDFDHIAVTRWSRAEVDKMQAWSKLGQSNMES
ncbi:hypothetical protein MVEN_01778800 [Mycena venus]|uniref:Uncharacterized protein n=1 Tax=Mycena venus TaxID=2733690 RepID=A0A8H6XNE9_9AGAR|nr:hypothetical protein MVEN_01778800 [Mycena venus]